MEFRRPRIRSLRVSKEKWLFSFELERVQQAAPISEIEGKFQSSCQGHALAVFIGAKRKPLTEAVPGAKGGFSLSTLWLSLGVESKVRVSPCDRSPGGFCAAQRAIASCLDKSTGDAILHPYMSKEQEEHRFRPRAVSEPVYPIPLPEPLAEFLDTQDIACLMHETTSGTVYVVKLPAREIDSVRGRVPIHVRHELWQHPLAPVIRTVMRIYDRPDNPLGLETMTNVAELDQRADFARLASQQETYLLFYDEALQHRLSKRIETTDRETVRTILAQADEMCRAIPSDCYDFMAAKADIMQRSKL
jgi:hypothetical protein